MQNKKNTIIAVILLILVFAIPFTIVKIMQANKPAWQKEVDERVKILMQKESETGIDEPMLYTQGIYAMYLVEGAGEATADSPDNWTYYSYLANQTYYTCSQIPGTTPSNDIPASEFVVCTHM